MILNNFKLFSKNTGKYNERIGKLQKSRKKSHLYDLQMAFPNENTNPVYNKLNVTVKPAITTETIVISLIRIFNEGPEVSLNGPRCLFRRNFLFQ